MKKWMSSDQRECFKMLADLFGGEHHIYRLDSKGSDVKCI